MTQNSINQQITIAKETYTFSRKLQESKSLVNLIPRGPRLWNNILDQQQKSIDHETIFKESVKLSLLSLENEIRFFQ